MQGEHDTEKAKLNSRINELAVALDRAKLHLVDRERTISELGSPRKPLVWNTITHYGIRSLSSTIIFSVVC